MFGFVQLVVHHYLCLRGISVHKRESFEILIARASRFSIERLRKPTVDLQGAARIGRLNLNPDFAGQVVQRILLGNGLCIERVGELGCAANSNVVSRTNRRLHDP